MLLRLTCVAGPLKGRVVDVSTPSFVVGRLPSSNLVIPPADALASRVHARIEPRGGSYVVIDQNSTNGTYLNGIRLEPFKACRVTNSDILRIGSSTFQVSSYAGSGRRDQLPDARGPQRQFLPPPVPAVHATNIASGDKSARRATSQQVTLLERIATGGMSVIYTARFADTKQVVVMKVPDEESASSPEVLRLFEREIATGLHLRHPNVIQVLMRIEYEGVPAMIMEYFPSNPLNILVSNNSLNAAQKLGVFAQISDGLSYVHGRGIVHNDVKPGNVLVGSGGLTKITDFGTAGTPASLKTAKDQWKLLGTTLYMSPEQIQGRDIDSRADIYGLGIVAYELLTGVNPFFKEGKNSAAEIMERQLSLTPPPPSAVLEGIPRAVDEPVMQALDKDPRNRTQTAQEFKNAMQKAWRQT